MEPGCIGKSHTNNLPAATDLKENPCGNFFKAAKSKIGHVGSMGNCSIIVTNVADFEKNVLIFEIKGGC
jgi:hypothetical protein